MHHRVAILSVHSHADRSFLDDRALALLAGDLRAAGARCDRVVALVDDETELRRALEPYDAIVYERVWDRRIVEALRAALPGRVFVCCEGEHALADPPAEFVCRGDLRSSVPALLAHLDGSLAGLPRDVLANENGRWREGLTRFEPPPRKFEPVLDPIRVGEPAVHTFSIEGNAGCPYRADARDNPLYAGVRIPEAYGRGCAFCTTGNRSESASADETAAKVMDQLRYVRQHAPSLELLVLKDQSPFGWLTEVVQSCAREGLTGFSLLLETRADWMLKNEARFERALEIADEADLLLCPFLVGIESFSQAELDRFNKGTTAELNERFLARLRDWASRHRSLDLSHASFGFVLLTPWTTMEDLRINLAAVERTGLDRMRGHLLVSRARLYPDTALYWLAERDGLLEQEHVSLDADSSRRYGYFPSTPWRFQEPLVARFAELAAELTRRKGGHDQRRIWRALLDALADDPEASIDDVEERLDPNDVRARFEKLVAPLTLERPFAGGWRFGDLVARRGRLSVHLEHEREGTVRLEILPRGRTRAFARSHHYDLCFAGTSLSAAQGLALREVCDAIAKNDVR